MQVTIDIPDAFAAELTAADKDPARVALEALMVEGYRSRMLSESQIKRILGYGTRMQVHELLATHDVPLNYDIQEAERDLATLRRLEADKAAEAA